MFAFVPVIYLSMARIDHIVSSIECLIFSYAKSCIYFTPKCLAMLNVDERYLQLLSVHICIYVFNVA